MRLPRKSEDRWKLATLVVAILSPLVAAITALVVASWNRPAPPAAKLFAECSLMPPGPVKAAPDKRVFSLVFSNSPIDGEGLAQESNGSEQFSYSNSAVAPVGHCRVTNYGSATATNITIPVQVIYREGIANSNRIEGGVIRASIKRPIQISKIDPGTESAFIFYMFNASSDFVFTQIMPNATFYYLGDPSPRSEYITVAAQTFPFFPPGDLNKLTPK